MNLNVFRKKGETIENKINSKRNKTNTFNHSTKEWNLSKLNTKGMKGKYGRHAIRREK